jgi:hypothetical protein
MFKYEREESLFIIDSLDAYFGQEPDRSFKERIATHVKEIGKNGLSILIDKGVYPYKGMFKELVNYGLSLPTIFELPLKRFCIFHQNDFDRLSEEQKQKLIEHHELNMRIKD